MTQQELVQHLIYLRRKSELFRLNMAQAIIDSRYDWLTLRMQEKARQYVTNPHKPTGDWHEDSDT